MRKIEPGVWHRVNGPRIRPPAKISQTTSKTRRKDRHRHLGKHAEPTRFDLPPRRAAGKMGFARPPLRFLRRATNAAPGQWSVSKQRSQNAAAAAASDAQAERLNEQYRWRDAIVQPDAIRGNRVAGDLRPIKCDRDLNAALGQF